MNETLKSAIDYIANHGNPYAKAYARVALTHNMEDDALKTQVMYILGNISHLRGEQAKHARQVLKEYVLS